MAWIALTVAALQLGSAVTLVTRSSPPSDTVQNAANPVLPPPAVYETVESRLFAGHRLWEAFFITEDEFDSEFCHSYDQGTFGEDDLIGYHSDWKKEAESVPEADSLRDTVGCLERVKAVDGLDLSTTSVRLLPTVKLTEPWIDTTYSQANPYTRAAEVYMPTHASYRSISSWEAKTLVIMSFKSPSYMNRGDGRRPGPGHDKLPRLQRLADIAYLDWARHLQFREYPNLGHSGTPPSWFLLKDVGENEDRAQDLAVLSWCLQNTHQTLRPWPGVTFPVGSTCFQAILGTDPSSEIAMFLVAHKYRFKASALASVTVFSEGSKINLLWFGGKMDMKELRAIEATNREFEKGKIGELEYPHPMTPRKIRAPVANMAMRPASGVSQ